jgi:transcriptional regulator with XRE-family HTH domain
MSSDSDASITERLREERNRLNLSHARIGDICDVRPATVVAWEKGSKIPADKLALLFQVGFDVQYIITGSRMRPVLDHEWIGEPVGAYYSDVNAELFGVTLKALVDAFAAAGVRLGIQTMGEMAALVYQDIVREVSDPAARAEAATQKAGELAEMFARGRGKKEQPKEAPP